MSDNNAEPEVKVRGTKQRRTTAKNKSKHSNWLLTISSNQRYKPDDPHKEADSEIFEEVVQDLSKNISKYINFRQSGHSWSKDHIDDVDVSYGIEWGEKSRALHCHVLVKIRHNSKISLDYDGIKDLFKERLGLPNIYFDSRLVKTTDEQYILSYISKMH
eukprot:51020-Eustigmatos_ZCMA.PRE.2